MQLNGRMERSDHKARQRDPNLVEEQLGVTASSQVRPQVTLLKKNFQDDWSSQVEMGEGTSRGTKAEWLYLL